MTKIKTLQFDHLRGKARNRVDSSPKGHLHSIFHPNPQIIKEKRANNKGWTHGSESHGMNQHHSSELGQARSYDPNRTDTKRRTLQIAWGKDQNRRASNNNKQPKSGAGGVRSARTCVEEAARTNSGRPPSVHHLITTSSVGGERKGRSGRHALEPAASRRIQSPRPR